MFYAPCRDAASGVILSFLLFKAFFVCVFRQTRLPDLDGLVFMRRLRSHWLLGDVPIVATSCNSAPAFRGEALAAGCNELLVKPLDFDHLERTLKKHLPQP